VTNGVYDRLRVFECEIKTENMLEKSQEMNQYLESYRVISRNGSEFNFRSAAANDE